MGLVIFMKLCLISLSGIKSHLIDFPYKFTTQISLHPELGLMAIYTMMSDSILKQILIFIACKSDVIDLEFITIKNIKLIKTKLLYNVVDISRLLCRKWRLDGGIVLSSLSCDWTETHRDIILTRILPAPYPFHH